MSIDSISVQDFEQTFASFDIAELEVLEVSQGVALPELGASGSSSSTSSSSSSTCSAC
jgi:thiazolylpeptide-type bacteriocin precursor